jgi:hypothetical protein
MLNLAAISGPGAGSQGAECAGDGETEQPDQQRGAPPVTVRQAARRQDERGEGEVVAVDDPLQAAGVGVEFGRDAGQGDVDDRDVEVDGEDCDVDGSEDPRLMVADGAPRVFVVGHYAPDGVCQRRIAAANCSGASEGT